MKAIYRGKIYRLADNLNVAVLIDDDEASELHVSYGDPDLIVDPTCSDISAEQTKWQTKRRQKMSTRYEVRTKGDGEWDWFAHPSDPEADNEANFDEGNLAEARRYAHELGGWVVEISEHKVPDCPYCEGSGLDPNMPGKPCPRCDSLMPPSTVGELTKAILSDVEAMRCECPDKDMWREEENQQDWFGPFSYTDTLDSEVSIQWPNLGILVAQLKEALIGHEKVNIGTPLDKS